MNKKKLLCSFIIILLALFLLQINAIAKINKEFVTKENLRDFANEEVEKDWNLPNYYFQTSLGIKNPLTNEVKERYDYDKETSWLTFIEKRTSIIYGGPHGDKDMGRFRYLGYTVNNSSFTNFLFRDDPGGFTCEVAKVAWIEEPWWRAPQFSDRFKTGDMPGDFSTKVPNKSIKDGLVKRYREYPIESQKKNLGDIDDIDWSKYVYVLQPPTKHTWGYGAMAYNGVGGERYQTLPLAPFVPVDLSVIEVTAVPEKAPSGSHIKLVAKARATFNEPEQINGTVQIKGWVEMAEAFKANIEASEWKKVDEMNYEAVKEITVKLPEVRVCGEFPLPAFVEINPVDKFGKRDYEEPDLNNNIGRTTATVESILKVNHSVIREGYIGWWDSSAVKVQWQERYWIVSGYRCRHDTYSHWVDTSHWSPWQTKQATRIFNGWNEAKLDFVPVGYNNIKSEYIPKHIGTGKIRVTAPWATDSKSLNMFSGYNTMRAGYGFTVDILAQLKGTYKQPSNIHQGIVNSIRLKLGTNFNKTARNTGMDKISSRDTMANSKEVDYNSTERDITGHTENNYVLTGEDYNEHGLRKTADRVISGFLYEYSNTTEQLWQLPRNASSKDNARKLYIDKSEADGRYILTGEGLFNNTKGLTTDSEHNRRENFNIGVYENMYHDTYPEEAEE